MKKKYSVALFTVGLIVMGLSWYLYNVFITASSDAVDSMEMVRVLNKEFQPYSHEVIITKGNGCNHFALDSCLSLAISAELMNDPINFVRLISTLRRPCELVNKSLKGPPPGSIVKRLSYFFDCNNNDNGGATVFKWKIVLDIKDNLALSTRPDESLAYRIILTNRTHL